MITYPVSEEQVHFLCPSTERTAMHCPRMKNPWKLRILLVLLALIFCLPLMAQNRFIEPHLDSMRLPPVLGLMPATYLFLRWLGQLSAWFPVCFMGLFGWSFLGEFHFKAATFGTKEDVVIHPVHVRTAFIVVAILSLIFMVAYVCYALLLLGDMLEHRHIWQNRAP